MPRRRRKPESPLAELCSQEDLRALAGERAFSKGLGYWGTERVSVLHGGDERQQVTAEVRGTRTYRTELWEEDGELGFSCSCPLGDEGVFCKHCVAVGLTIEAGHAGASEEGPDGRFADLDELRAFLADQSKDFLVDLLLERVAADEGLLQRLEMLRASSRDGPDVAKLSRWLDTVLEPGDVFSYRETADFAERVGQAVELLRDLLEGGHAAAVIELTEHALALIEEAIEQVDDSDGDLWAIASDLQEIHRGACTQARPDPEELARRLFDWEMRTGWDTFHGAVTAYSEVLGTNGLAVYRELAEAEWKAIPPLAPGDSWGPDHGRRIRLTSILEGLARLAGDLEALVALRARDLSSAYAFLQIAELYQEVGQEDRAIEWAERGLQAFPERTDSRLRLFLAEAYRRHGRHDEAVALAWSELMEQPTIESYERLLLWAGRDRESEWREKVHALLRARAQEKKGADWARLTASSQLVQILLHDDDVEGA